MIEVVGTREWGGSCFTARIYAESESKIRWEGLLCSLPCLPWYYVFYMLGRLTYYDLTRLWLWSVVWLIQYPCLISSHLISFTSKSLLRNNGSDRVLDMIHVSRVELTEDSVHLHDIIWHDCGMQSVEHSYDKMNGWERKRLSFCHSDPKKELTDNMTLYACMRPCLYSLLTWSAV